MKALYAMIAALLATIALAVALNSCSLIGPTLSSLRWFDTTAPISSSNGNTIIEGKYRITVADAQIDEVAYRTTGGLALRWLVLNITVGDSCNNVLMAGVQRFPLMPHECPTVPLWPPPLILGSDDTTNVEKSGGADR